MAAKRERRMADEGRSEDLHEILAKTNAQIEEIFAAAEQKAADAQAEAEAEAETYLRRRRQETDSIAEERRRQLDELSTGLTDRAARLQRQLGETATALQELADWISAATRTPEPSGDDQLARTADPDPAPEPRQAGRGRPSSRRDTEAAVLRATQLMVGGCDQEEVARTLRAEFDISDPDPLVAEVFARHSGFGPQLGRLRGPASADRPGQTG